MKALGAFLVLLSATCILGEAFMDATPFLDFSSYKQLEHSFGAVHYHKETPEGSESKIFFPHKGLFGHPEHFDEYKKSFLLHQNNPEIMEEIIQDGILTCDEEHKADYLKFFPTFIGGLTPSNSTFTFSAPCWQDNVISLNIVDDHTVEIIHTIKNASKLGCGDTFFLSTLSNFHTTAYLIAGTHKSTFNLTDEEMQFVKTVGMQVFRTCDAIKDVIPDAIKTMYLFMGEIALATGLNSHNKSVPTKWDVEQSLEFIKEATGYEWMPRADNLKDVILDIDESQVNSGDFFAVKKFDGTGNLVEYGTGAHVNHCTVALRVNGTLYIAESNADFEWPVGGIQMNEYQTWVGWAKNQGYQVTWLPLKQEYAQKFDSDAAYAFFKQYEGVPYGIHNYIWGWLDTPDHSYPPLLRPEFFGFMFAFLEQYYPDAAQSMFGMAMNKRLNTENLTVAQLAQEAYNRNLTLPDLYGMTEVDGWLYQGNVSYVCSAFVTAILKAGGLFDGMEINAVEFTPRDVYQLEFYDPAPVLPTACTSVDPTNPYCQIMGQYIMTFPQIGVVQPYAHMNEKCWSEPPLYEIYPPGC